MKKTESIDSVIEFGMLLLTTAHVGYSKDKRPMVGTFAHPKARPTAESIRVVRDYRDGLRQKVAYLTKWIKAADKEADHAS